MFVVRLCPVCMYRPFLTSSVAAAVMTSERVPPRRSAVWILRMHTDGLWFCAHADLAARRKMNGDEMHESESDSWYSDDSVFSDRNCVSCVTVEVFLDLSSRMSNSMVAF
jgi:hypothetical protein